MIGDVIRLLTMFLVGVALVTPASAVSVTATLDRPSMAVGDTATLQLRIYDGRVQSVPNIPAPANLTIQFAGQGNEYRNFNGVASSALVLNYAVTASTPGTFTIPSVRVQVEGASYNTQPLNITVTKTDASVALAAFIKVIPSKTNVYVGELFPIEIKVYGFAIDEMQIPVLKSEGFTIGAQAQGVRSREQMGNNLYNIYTFPVSISAAKAGNLMLGPAESAASIRVQVQGSRRSLLDEMWGGGFQRKQVTLSSEPIPIRVNPLPTQNVPPSFNGAVGNFQMTVRPSATNVAVGDPITLDIKITGRGAFDSLKLPDFGWKDFTFYQPNTSVTNRDTLGLQAIKSFDQVIVPQRAGITAIPALVFGFFDPEQGVYKTMQNPPIPITVRATGLGQAQPTVVADPDAQAQQPSRASDIVHIKPSAGHLAAITAPLPLRPWFALLNFVPVAIWLAAMMHRKRADQLANDPRLRRKIEVARIVAEGFPQLREAAQRNESEKFFATGFRLLQEQIGERLNLPAAAITEAVLDEKLKTRAPADVIERLHELFQACNQARYAGVTIAGMEALIPKFESALQEVQKLPGEGTK